MPSWQCHRACDDPVIYRVLPHFCLLQCRRRYGVGGGSLFTGQSCLSQLGRVLRIQLSDNAWFRAHVSVKGSSRSPFADCLCQKITQNSVLRKERNGSDIDAQRDASCTRNVARLQHLNASGPALAVPRAPVDTKWLRTGLGTLTPQCRLLTAATEAHARPSERHGFALTGSISDSGDPIFGIVCLSCSAIAACSCGETLALRLTVNYCVLCAKKWSNHPTSIKKYSLPSSRTFDTDISIDVQIDISINNRLDFKLSTVTSEFPYGSGSQVKNNMPVHVHICLDTDTDTDIDIDIDIDIGTDTDIDIRISISSWCPC